MKSPLLPGGKAILIDQIGLDEIEKLYPGFDIKKYFSIETIDIYKCQTSGYRFFYPFDLSGDSSYYSSLQNSSSYYLKDRWEYQLALNQINNANKILEIGCGEGNFLEMLKANGLIGYGTELSETAAEKCVEKGLNVTNLSVANLSETEYEKYDVVCFFQVLEHISEVNSFITNVIKLTKPGGMIIFSVPNNDSFIYPTMKFNKFNLPPHHMGLWNKKSILSLEKIFKIKLIRYKEESLKPYCSELYLTYLKRLIKKIKGGGRIIDIIPQMVLKKLIFLISPFVKGHTSYAVFKKL